MSDSIEEDIDVDGYEAEQFSVSCFGENETGEESSSKMVSNGDEVNERCGLNELYVWPWMGVMVNVPVQLKDGRYVGESGSKLKDELTKKGFKPLRVHPLWNFKGHTGFAIVEFRNHWDGLADALRFEKEYEVKHHGRKDYLEAKELGHELYCWVAREDDFHSRNAVGDHLQKRGDLKTISQVQEEERNRNQMLVSDLTNTIEGQNVRLMEIEKKYKETSVTVSLLMSEKDKMAKHFNEERQKMQQNERSQLERISQERERIILELEAQRNGLKQKEEELEKREAWNENARQKLKYEKEQNEQAILMQMQADEKILKLGEDHKREKEELRRKMIELERKFDAKQALELEVERLQGKLQVVKHMEDDIDDEGAKKMHAIQRELEEKEEELQDMEELHQTLIIKERRTSDELEEARKELINVFEKQPKQASLVVKRFGDLNSKAFIPAAKRKSRTEWDVTALKLCSQWDSHIRDPEWQPFKITPVEDGKCYKTILDEDNLKLVNLRSELGEQAYKAVTAALMEINEHNPSERYVVPVLWHKNEGRKATIKEGISYLIKQWSTQKKKKR